MIDHASLAAVVSEKCGCLGGCSSLASKRPERTCNGLFWTTSNHIIVGTVTGAESAVMAAMAKISYSVSVRNISGALYDNMCFLS